ncbi:hypothetical protein VXM60_10480 [Shewanella khirikhana]|uniref:hypothetical protein n=1 Tax=Shewanella khirikhana TaxID=1965282 RepID=UPI0030D14141
MKLQVFVPGVRIAKGLNKSGGPLDMGGILQLCPLRPWKNDNAECRVAGFGTPEHGDSENKPIYCGDDVYKKAVFLEQSGKLPAYCELDVSVDMMNGMKLTCTDIKVLCPVPLDYSEFLKSFKTQPSQGVSNESKPESSPAKTDNRSVSV